MRTPQSEQTPYLRYKTHCSQSSTDESKKFSPLQGVPPSQHVGTVYLLPLKPSSYPVILFEAKTECSPQTHGTYSPRGTRQMSRILPGPCSTTTRTHDRVQRTILSSAITRGTASTKQYEGSPHSRQGQINTPASAPNSQSLLRRSRLARGVQPSICAFRLLHHQICHHLYLPHQNRHHQRVSCRLQGGGVPHLH
jgi:hypothetical protein